MKCPYCGAEVSPNSRCEYCGSFMEPDSTEQATQGTEEINWNAQNVANYRTQGKHRITVATLGMLLLLVLVGIAYLWFFTKSAGGFDFKFKVLEPVTTKLSGELRKLHEGSGRVEKFDYDGYITILEDGDSFTTRVIDKELLEWLERTERSLEGIAVEYSTDESGNIDRLAMSSMPFYVIGEQAGKYILLREGKAFVATAGEALKQGAFYEGYLNYPQVNVQTAEEINPSNTVLFDPVCERKREITVSDYYGQEEIVVWQIAVDGKWYYCTKELYELSTEGECMQGSISKDYETCVVYINE